MANNIDLDQLRESIMIRFWRCNEMTRKQAEDYAWIAVHEMQKPVLRPIITNPATKQTVAVRCGESVQFIEVQNG